MKEGRVGGSRGECAERCVPGGKVERGREKAEREKAVGVGREGGGGEEGELGLEGGVIGEEEEMEAEGQFGEDFLTDVHLLSRCE